MERLLTWHLNVSAVTVRLFQLHVLWLAWTLRGMVVVGVFPATAAVYAVLRRDVLDEAATTDGWSAVRQRFRDAWFAELGVANRRGYLLAAAWLLLMVNRRAVDLGLLGAAGPTVAVLLAMVTVLLAATTAYAEVLAAHFAEAALAAIRRAALLAVARPGATLLNLLGVGVICYAYARIPGLIPVFGVALPAWLSTQYLWSTGILGHPRHERAEPVLPSIREVASDAAA